MTTRLIATILAMLVAIGAIVAALTASHGSSANYKPFDRCPLSDPATDLCLYMRAEEGTLTVGRATVPLSRGITFQGGLHEVKNASMEILADQFIAAPGSTISSALQLLPGGLAATVDPTLLPHILRRAYNAAIAHGAATVAATIELAGSPDTIKVNIQHLVETHGTAIVLPIKIRLTGALLGDRCYIASNAHPIELSLTTGKTAPPWPATPIRGKVSQASFYDDYNLTVIHRASFVDNSFAAPAVTGCGGSHSVQVDRAVNAQIGLPSPAGNNTVIFEGQLENANASAVRRARVQGVVG